MGIPYRRFGTTYRSHLQGSSIQEGKCVKKVGVGDDIEPDTRRIYYYYYWYSALGPVWAETRVQSGDWYGSGTLHPGQVLTGSLPLLSPAF